MRLKEIHFDNSLPIDGYGPGFFRVGGMVHKVLSLGAGSLTRRPCLI